MEQETAKVKTSGRIYNEAQIQAIRSQIGGLESFRNRLGLSQRKMAQLLLVDPSAWTRWIQNEMTAPAHVWRALQWYAALIEKIPGLTPNYFLGGDHRKLQAELELKIDKRLKTQNEIWFDSFQHFKSLDEEVGRLKKLNTQLRLYVMALGFAMLLLSGFLLFLVFNRLS